MVGRIYVGDNQTLLHTIGIVSSGAHGFREEDSWRFLSYTVLYKHMYLPWGMAGLDPRGLTGRV